LRTQAVAQGEHARPYAAPLQVVQDPRPGKDRLSEAVRAGHELLGPVGADATTTRHSLRSSPRQTRTWMPSATRRCSRYRETCRGQTPSAPPSRTRSVWWSPWPTAPWGLQNSVAPLI
jgi:hypothetical protein